MAAVSTMVQFVAAKNRVMGYINVQGIAYKTNVIADDARAFGIVELDAITAL